MSATALSPDRVANPRTGGGTALIPQNPPRSFGWPTVRRAARRVEDMCACLEGGKVQPTGVLVAFTARKTPYVPRRALGTSSIGR